MLNLKRRMPLVHTHAQDLGQSLRSALHERVGVAVEVELWSSDSSGDSIFFSSVLKSHGCLSEHARSPGSVYFTHYWFI